MKCITDTSKRSKKEFFDIMTKSTVGRLQASAIFIKIAAKCEEDFKERAKELINASKEIE